uniref:Uncharacterized protein n=1 Tax=Setaria viridis TaxID=4556 RepID=A0A4U6UT88_SETVI|nr:hypothetical protein SEVIR_5G444100v2 [Setaria viridis]
MTITKLYDQTAPNFLFLRAQVRSCVVSLYHLVVHRHSFFSYPVQLYYVQLCCWSSSRASGDSGRLFLAENCSRTMQFAISFYLNTFAIAQFIALELDSS